jgi:hypothetical protein
MATSGLSRPDVIARQRSDRSLENCTAHNVAHQLCDAVHRRPIEELVTLARSPPQTNLEARPTTPLSVGPFFVREPLPQTEARSPPRRPPAARRASGSRGEVALEASAPAKLRTLYQRDPRWVRPAGTPKSSAAARRGHRPAQDQWWRSRPKEKSRLAAG